MAVLETAQAQELINYAKEIGREELPTLVSNNIAEIRKTFANAITTDIDRPLGEQITALVKACEENGIELVVDKADLFCYNEFETLRIAHEYTDNEGNSGEILVDVFITTELHNQNGEETEENQFLICPDYADVVISLNDTNKGDIIFQDIVGNQLAKLLKGDNVRLQINYNTVMDSGKTFVYDGCHKLYVITSEEERQHAKEFNRETSAGICMIGKPGTGKTTLLAAICNELLAKNHSCLFITMSALFDKFTKYSYDNAGDISGLLNWLTEFDFIVLDDIGRGGESEKRQEIAYRIIDTLLNYEVPTCVTANPEMLAIIDSFPAWRAIIDRLKDMCEIRIEFKGSTNRGRKWQ